MTERIITDRNGRKYITTEPKPQQTAATCPRKSPVSNYTCTPCGNGPCRAEIQAQTAATDIHSCSYYCDRPACIKAQRAELLAELDKARKSDSAKQAKIDALMFEYCPDEMTTEQTDEWAKHQRPVSVELSAAITAAIQQEPT